MDEKNRTIRIISNWFLIWIEYLYTPTNIIVVNLNTPAPSALGDTGVLINFTLSEHKGFLKT